MLSVAVWRHQWGGLYDSLSLRQCCGCCDYSIWVFEGPNRHALNAVSVFLYCAVPDCVGAGTYSWETQRSCGLLVKRCSLFFSPAGTKSKGTAGVAPGRDPGSSRRLPAGLEISDLEKRAEAYFHKGLGDSSHQTYRSRENRYLWFGHVCDCAPLPVSEENL